MTVNDLVADRGFKGKFAAMTVCILNIQNGRLRVSHAGDRILLIYRSATKSIEATELNDVPAAGVWSADLFPPNMEHQEAHRDIEPGDILILATDGIEDSKRVLQNAEYVQIRVAEKEFDGFCASQGWTNEAGAKELGFEWKRDNDGFHEIKEPFTTSRMNEVIEKVLAGGKYMLERAMNPDPDEILEFDFKRVEPTAENAVLGLMSVEKVFRLQLDPTATERDMVQVDRKIAEFLKDHFSLYARYFRYEVPEEQRPDNRAEYLWFSHLKEAVQFDDLTILAIRKK